jgi:hypothetical protein
MAEHESKQNPDNRNLISRRKALAGTACGIVATVPVVAAARSVEGVDRTRDDPGLAQLEGGYVHWQKLSAKANRAYWRADDAWGRASRKYDARVDPAPARPPELEPIGKVMGGSMEQVLDPNHPLTLPPDLLEMYRAYHEAWEAWLDGRPSMTETMADDPDYKKYLRINKQALWDKTSILRDELLAIPTRAPRGIMIKLALAVGAENLGDGLLDALQDNQPDNELWPALLADLQAMEREGVA